MTFSFFLLDINICNFADDMTPFVWDETLGSVIELEGDSDFAIFWFENNYKKLNTDKCHLLISGTKYEHSWAKISDDKIWESNEVKLKFDGHIANICFKANQN